MVSSAITGGYTSINKTASPQNNPTMKQKIFFIDPQSMSNLAEYDYSVTSEMDCDLTYLCSKHYDYAVNERIKYVRVFSYNYKKGVAKIFSYLFSLLYILLLIIRQRPALVHIQWFKIPQIDFLFWSLAKKAFSFKIVHTAHNILPHNTGDRYKKIYTRIYRELADSIIVHDNSTRDKLAREIGVDTDKITVIRHGLLKMKYDTRKYEGLRLPSSCLDALKDKIVFVSLGEQSYYKGSDLIIDAWASTPSLNQSDRCALVIAGKITGIDMKDIGRFGNVIVRNERISNEEYMFWLRHADAYLLPYRAISQSGALLTALSVHLPVITSDIGGISEPTEVAKVGWNMGQPSVENLRQVLSSILDDPDSLKAIKGDTESWEKIEKFYDWKDISLRTQSLYEKLLR